MGWAVRPAALATVLLGACALPGGELLGPPPASPAAFTDCTTALAKASEGAACLGIGTCSEPTSDCCKRVVICESGVVVKAGTLCAGCKVCETDDGCGLGEWCLAKNCQACPAAANCPPCPAPFKPLMRHGCATCDCGPVAACENGCPNTGPCITGAYCVADCSGASCCTGVCAPSPNCVGPWPEGCTMPCGPVSCGSVCRAEGCTCGANGWNCQPRCASGLEQYVSRCKAL